MQPFDPQPTTYMYRKCMTTDYLALINRPMSLAVLADDGDAFSHDQNQIQNSDVTG